MDDSNTSTFSNWKVSGCTVPVVDIGLLLLTRHYDLDQLNYEALSNLMNLGGCGQCITLDLFP